ncbi:LRP chaperone MESD [Dillenia turbinata]|uniref:LRP chaperone MESD n=1 Tax=Dillenia turbinata TaxID=194707 RepID=A0AAN8Z2I9_9MAGN
MMTPLSLLLLLLFFLNNSNYFCTVVGGKGRIHIPDELDDVVDDEEDEAWKQWGQMSSSKLTEFDPPPENLSEMEPDKIREELMKGQMGLVFGFVKLRLGVRRTPEKVAEIAMQWTKVLKTGAVEVNFMGVDVSTIMFTMNNGQDAFELRDFVLSQPEAYEIKIGDQVFRRPGDPPLDEVFEKLQHEKNNVDGSASALETDEDTKDEL